MSKVKYRFNTKSLTYEKVKVTFSERLWRFMSYLAIGLVFATVTIILAFKFLDSPKEKMLRREIEALQLQYDLLHKKMNQVQVVLNDMQDRDDNIYRVIFEAEPIPNTIRNAGFGGSERYEVFDNYENADLLKRTTERLDKITKQ
ncbi:MAG TPA: M23 family peptidase, partial [Bacteroidia bacterium]|nr:M23 family peptidase [Bacteroidia bacterium]